MATHSGEKRVQISLMWMINFTVKGILETFQLSFKSMFESLATSALCILSNLNAARTSSTSPCVPPRLLMLTSMSQVQVKAPWHFQSERLRSPFRYRFRLLRQMPSNTTARMRKPSRPPTSASMMGRSTSLVLRPTTRALGSAKRQRAQAIKRWPRRGTRSSHSS